MQKRRQTSVSIPAKTPHSFIRYLLSSPISFSLFIFLLPFLHHFIHRTRNHHHRRRHPLVRSLFICESAIISKYSDALFYFSELLSTPEPYLVRNEHVQYSISHHIYLCVYKFIDHRIGGQKQETSAVSM